MDYIHALIKDLQCDLAEFPYNQISSIFIGGGTPSLVSAKAYEKLFNEIQKITVWDKDLEITLEANPGTFEQQRFKDYRSLGINRLSMGIQSFNPEHLKILGRIHDDKQAREAINVARQAGFRNINLDIMYSLPNQTIEQGVQDLQTALSFEPEHLSWYQLTIEPNTIFYKKTPTLPDEDTTLHLENQGFSLLASKGYERYEISAFCKPGKPSHHNLNYWLFGDYFGIGAGAHGKLTTPAQQVWRTNKSRQPNDYLADSKAFLAAKTEVSPQDLLFEFMLNTTRLQQAIPNSLFTERTGLSFELLRPLLLQAQKAGLITVNEMHWKVTELGRRFTNDLQALFLPQESEPRP